MSLPTPIWLQRDKAECSGTLAALLPASSSDSDSGCALEDYSGLITEIPPAEVFPPFGSRLSDAVPAAIQNQLRIKTLLQQLPPQDCDERYCPSIGEEERKQLRTFAAQRRQEALGQGVMCVVPSTLHGCICKKCGEKMSRGEQGVFASKLGLQCWHPICFACHCCHQPLVDLIYFHRDGKIYCGRHHAEFIRPRCASCDQLIFTSECMEAEGLRWHEEHFCCLECDLPLGAQQYVMKGGQPCCCACFESLYADICQACGEIIGVDSEQASLHGQHWHANASCFCCSSCHKALQGELVTTHHGLLFCSEACSLETESVLSSTGSDSSDSAFISAPSPDATPISKAKTSGPAARTNMGACEEISEANGLSQKSLQPPPLRPLPYHKQFVEQSPGLEQLYTSGNSSLCPEFLSYEEEEIVFENKTTSPLFEPPADSPQEVEDTSSLHPLETDQKQVGNPHFRSSLFTAPNASVLIMDTPQRLQEGSPVEQQQDAYCPTCSSSSDSDSEPEGFFFGKPIPKPGPQNMTLPMMEQQSFGKGVGWATRARASHKHCRIS